MHWLQFSLMLSPLQPITAFIKTTPHYWEDLCTLQAGSSGVFWNTSLHQERHVRRQESDQTVFLDEEGPDPMIPHWELSPNKDALLWGTHLDLSLQLFKHTKVEHTDVCKWVSCFHLHKNIPIILVLSQRRIIRIVGRRLGYSRMRRSCGIFSVECAL